MSILANVFIPPAISIPDTLRSFGECQVVLGQTPSHASIPQTKMARWPKMTAESEKLIDAESVR